MAVFTDKFDLRVTASSEASVRILNDFGDALLGFTDQVGCIITLADNDPDCPLAQAYAAEFYASAETSDGIAKAQKYLTRALALAPGALPREQKIIHAAKHWCHTERRAAASVLEDVLDANPDDIISAKFAQSLHFDTGNSVGILRAPLKVAERCDANPHLHGMLAFGYEECHLIDLAERSVMRAVEIKRAEPWAHHAMAHISEARNQLVRGIDFMMDMSDTWNGLTSFMTTHNWWHVCLLLVDLNRGDEALAYFDKVVWARDQACVQDQINAISLLYRLERIGVDPGPRWQAIAAAILKNARSQISVFLDFQFLYALARADHPEASAMVDRMRSKAEAANPDEAMAWRDVAVPIAPGIVALAKGDYVTAAWQIGQARPSLQSIGGSHAQRDLVALFYIDALYGAQDWGRLQKILSVRHRARPGTSWIKRQLSEAYENLGLPGVLASAT